VICRECHADAVTSVSRNGNADYILIEVHASNVYEDYALAKGAFVRRNGGLPNGFLNDKLHLFAVSLL